MRKRVLLLFWIIGTLFITSSFAKVGVLDVEKLLVKTGAADRAMDKIRKQYAPRYQALKKEQQKVESDLKKYNKISGRLTPPEIKEWQHKLNEEVGQIQQKQNMLQEEAATAQNLASQKVVASFFAIVSKIAEKNGLEVVFFEDVTASYQTGLEVQEITNEVIKRFIKK